MTVGEYVRRVSSEVVQGIEDAKKEGVDIPFGTRQIAFNLCVDVNGEVAQAGSDTAATISFTVALDI